MQEERPADREVCIPARARAGGGGGGRERARGSASPSREPALPRPPAPPSLGGRQSSTHQKYPKAPTPTLTLWTARNHAYTRRGVFLSMGRTRQARMSFSEYPEYAAHTSRNRQNPLSRLRKAGTCGGRALRQCRCPRARPPGPLRPQPDAPPTAR